jgi:hypothetical protein
VASGDLGLIAMVTIAVCKASGLASRRKLNPYAAASASMAAASPGDSIQGGRPYCYAHDSSPVAPHDAHQHTAGGCLRSASQKPPPAPNPNPCTVKTARDPPSPCRAPSVLPLSYLQSKRAAELVATNGVRQARKGDVAGLARDGHAVRRPLKQLPQRQRGGLRERGRGAWIASAAAVVKRLPE